MSSLNVRKNYISSKYVEGRLDGMTILRFTHATKSAGGVEQHLELLNRVLLERNRMTIIQMYSVNSDVRLDEEIERIGQGKLIWIPMLEQDMEYERPFRNWIRNILHKFKLEYIVSQYIIYNPIFSIFLKNFFHKNHFGAFYCATAAEKTRKLYRQSNIDLIMLHSLSSSDSQEIINAAKDNCIPYAVQHHFDSIRLKRPYIREKLLYAAGVGGVSRTGVPRYLKHRFVNLSSGIDTEFFKPDNAKQFYLGFEEPVAFLPSRIVPGKGHFDLIHAATRLKREGMPIKIVFAGRHDSPQFEKKLKDLINQLNISDAVMFLGQLTLQELRDWYAVSKVVVLPSYSEGLPRVLLEAQAMRIPPVAYNVGGVSEALKNGYTGFIVRKGNMRELAARLKELFTDNYRRKQMGEAGRKFIEEHFGLAALAKRHEEFYLDAIQK